MHTTQLAMLLAAQQQLLRVGGEPSHNFFQYTRARKCVCRKGLPGNYIVHPALAALLTSHTKDKGLRGGYPRCKTQKKH
jgi:hypothetical protein